MTKIIFFLKHSVTKKEYLYLYNDKFQNRLDKNDDITMLLEACKRRDQKAQIAVYQRYAKAMYQVAVRITGNCDDAEDVMQEAFIKAFDKLHSYKAKASFGAWLKRIVVNEALSWLRQRKNMTCIDRIDTVIESEPDIDIDENKVKIELVLDAINRLRDNYRVAVNLYFIEGYDYEEMMQILNLSYANVRTLVSRAKQKLKENLENITD